MDEIDKSRDFRFFDLGITTTFFFGMSSTKRISLWMKLLTTICC